MKNRNFVIVGDITQDEILMLLNWRRRVVLKDALLLEDGNTLLLEDGNKFQLETGE